MRCPDCNGESMEVIGTVQVRTSNRCIHTVECPCGASFETEERILGRLKTVRKSATGSVVSLVSVPAVPSAGRGRPDKQEYPKEFLDLWQATGKYGNKMPAFKTWQRIKTSVDLNTLVTAWGKWMKTDQWSRGYVPFLATWLNRRGWEDEPPAWAYQAPAMKAGMVPQATQQRIAVGQAWLERKMRE